MKTSLPTDAAAARERAEFDAAMELLSDVLSAAAPGSTPPSALRQRLLGRVADSAARHEGLITVRRSHAPAVTLGTGASVRWLYDAGRRGRRPGEPQRLALIELAAGARVGAGLALAGCHSEWLVVQGSARIDGVALSRLDHHGRAASRGEPVLYSERGALLYLRDSADEPTPAGTTREAPERWEDYAPGIRRRVLWQSGDATAYLARACNGASVPAHRHRHDEECLMLEGDLFTGDVLLREGELQLAPVGIDHGLVQAASDCLVYIRGDAELDLLPA